MKNSTNRATYFTSIFLRVALALSFLSAVADRFGWWGAPGAPGVTWGNYDKFLEYTAQLNSFVPSSLIPILGALATGAETVLALALLIGFRLRETAILSGLLLLAFAFGMITGTGIKGPFDYSVFTAAGGAFLLAALAHEKSLANSSSTGAQKS